MKQPAASGLHYGCCFFCHYKGCYSFLVAMVPCAWAQETYNTGIYGNGKNREKRNITTPFTHFSFHSRISYQDAPCASRGASAHYYNT